ncbi:MAG: hypothetical protein V1822_04240 [Candidatus Micrarchaeota archaeon]
MAEDPKPITDRTYWRILIEAKSEFDIQGVNLRETIAKELHCPGKISNRKDGKVELLLYCSQNDARSFCTTLKRLKPIMRSQATIFPPSEKLFDFDHNKLDLIVERSDDLKEMVWGLQGAGKAIAEQSEKQRTGALSSIVSILGNSVEASGQVRSDYISILVNIIANSQFDNDMTLWLLTFHQALRLKTDGPDQNLSNLIASLNDGKFEEDSDLFKLQKARKAQLDGQSSIADFSYNGESTGKDPSQKPS